MFYWYLMKVVWLIKFECLKNIQERHSERFHCIAIEIKSQKQYIKRKRETLNTGVNKTTKCTVNWTWNNYLESIRKYLPAASNSYSIVGFLLCFRSPRHVRTYSNNLCIIFTGSDIQLVKRKFLCNKKIFYTFVTDGQI